MLSKAITEMVACKYKKTVNPTDDLAKKSTFPARIFASVAMHVKMMRIHRVHTKLMMMIVIREDI